MKKELARIAVGVALFFVALLSGNDTLNLILYLLAYVICGIDVVYNAIRNIFKGEVFDEHFLMALATIGAICIKEYPEAVLVMILYQVGEMFQDYAVDKSKGSIEALMNIRPDYANLLKDGESVKVKPEEVNIGDVIIVRAGEKIPLDGVVISGSSMLDTSALTGEAVPRSIETGGEALSGTVNLSGVLEIRVEKEFGKSTVSKILELVENATEKKSQSENFITKFARIYTPIVVVSAVILAAIPPLLFGADFSAWLYRALTFLVVSCPCALVISIPLSYFGGLGGASRQGILIKGSNYLEALSNVSTAVFDKTGTLTEGVFEVTSIITRNIEEKELLRLAAHAESFSSHPVAKSVLSAYRKEIDKSIVTDVTENAGRGISAVVDKKIVLIGNTKLMADNSIAFEACSINGTVLYIAVDGEYKGCIVISDKVKPDSKQAIKLLKSIGTSRIVMLTGDTDSAGKSIASELGIDEVYTQLLPTDKVERVEELLMAKPADTKLIFAGDGINDAPVLARADIGIAMGGLGSDAAIEAADVVIMNDEPSKIATAISISKRTRKIVRQNIVFALAVKIAVLILAAVGISNMWQAVFADVGVSVLAVLNAMRTLKKKEIEF